LLRGGSTVTFNSQGVHRWTTSRAGHATEFVDSAGVLKQINLPPTGSGLSYTFSYSPPPLRLTSVTAPDSGVGMNRVTTLAWVGDTLSISDPASPAVVFGYEPGTNRITYRRDRRGAAMLFDFDEASRLAHSRVGVPGADSIIKTFCAAEVRGLASCSPTPVLPDSSYAVLDGPRLPSDSTDVMHFWIDQFGQPV